MTTGVLWAVLIAGCLPRTGAWVDLRLLRRTAQCPSHSEIFGQHQMVVQESSWRRQHSLGAAGRAGVGLAAASDQGAAENATVDWLMDTRVTSVTVSLNGTAAKPTSPMSRHRHLQRQKVTSRHMVTSQDDEATEGEQQPPEAKQRKQTRRQDAEAETPLSEGVNTTTADSKSGEGASRKPTREARVRQRRRAATAAAAADAAEAPPPVEEEEATAPAVQQQPLVASSAASANDAVTQGQGGVVKGEEAAAVGAAAASKKPAPTRGRGFGKKAPPPAKEEDGGGQASSESKEFSRIIKLLKLKPDEFAMARRVVEEVFGPDEAEPWLAELEMAAKSQGVRIPATESRSRIKVQRPPMPPREVVDGAKEAKADVVQEKNEAEAAAEVAAPVPVAARVEGVEEGEEKREPRRAAAAAVVVEEEEEEVMEELKVGEEVTLPMEKLGLKKRLPHKPSPAIPPPPPPPAPPEPVAAEDTGAERASSARGPAKGAGRRRAGKAGRGGEDEEEDDKLLETTGDDEEEVDEEEDAEALKENVDESVLLDKRVVSTHIKDAKLTEYIKDKKNSRTTRDKFLADVGLVRAEVHPPQRFVEVYYNNWADDFYTAITTSSNRFGPRWWFREALSHSPADVMAWLRNWYRMAKKHGVLHDTVGRMLSEALKDTPGGAGETEVSKNRAEMRRYTALKDRMRKWREPRIIAIGDVHGCIDEVRALIKKVEYGPGDLVVFLGDLVAKGPDSVEVVRLAREIGALSVRGNHENEVIKWSRAMALGSQSNFKSEHYLIAMGLSEEDIEWLRSLPWYISCSDLQLLFVHAGFVSNLRLSKQHPRFMINMRSILSDGTVSARYYQDYPWARTWTGPQTVLFGHDARRGMQAYNQALGLDTGCVYGGNLTACVMPGRQIVQVKAAEAYIVQRYERIMRRAETLKESMRDS